MTKTNDPDALLARVRAICFDFAGAEEKLSHGAPFFHVRGKGFVIFAGNHHGDGRTAAWCKATPEEQRRLTKSRPELYFVPPYVGVKGWVGARLDLPTSDFDELAVLVEEAWRSVVPKRLEGAAPGPAPKPLVYPTTDPAVAAEALSRLATICAALPGSTSDEGGGPSTFRVGKKPFAYLMDNVHRDGIVSVCFKLPPDEATELVASSPRRYYAPPYIGARGWVAMRVDTGKVPWKELARRVTESHRSVAPKRGASATR